MRNKRAQLNIYRANWPQEIHVKEDSLKYKVISLSLHFNFLVEVQEIKPVPSLTLNTNRCSIYHQKIFIGIKKGNACFNIK